MFGHTINLNFNKEGDSHQTAAGGSISILIRLVMTLYVFMNFKKMLLHEDDSNVLEIDVLDLEEFGDQSYNQTDIFLYHVMRKQLSGALFLSADTARYVDIFYNKVQKNYYKAKTDPEYYQAEEIPAK